MSAPTPKSKTRSGGCSSSDSTGGGPQQGIVGVQLGYKEDTGTVRGLLREPTLGIWDEFCCPNSLREIEPTVNLIIGDWQQDAGLAGAPPFQLGTGESRPRPAADTAEDEEAAEVDQGAAG